MKEDWPRICTNTQLYRQLFKSVVIDIFKVISFLTKKKLFQALIGRDLRAAEQKLLESLPNISTAPISLFEKRTGKFDALLGVGISNGLQGFVHFLDFHLENFRAVASFFDNIQKIREDCSKYEKTSMDANVESIRVALAEDFSEIVGRYSKIFMLLSNVERQKENRKK